MENKKYYVVYQITNNINDKIYIGCHITENINDKYFGSGTNIKKAIKDFGKENFKKIILYNFNTKDEMLKKEKELVNDEFIKRGDTYNIILGGGFYTNNTITVKDKNGNSLKVHKTDPRYLSGELIGITHGYVVIKDKNGDIKQVSIDDPQYLSGEYVHCTSNTVNIRDKNGDIIRVDITDSRLQNSEYEYLTKGFVNVKDKNNNTLQISIDDPRYLSGELKCIWDGKKHKLKTRIKMSNSKKGKGLGDMNSQYGTCWIYNVKIKENKKINVFELNMWLNDGWLKGRKINFG